MEAPAEPAPITMVSYFKLGVPVEEQPRDVRCGLWVTSFQRFCNTCRSFVIPSDAEGPSPARSTAEDTD